MTTRRPYPGAQTVSRAVTVLKAFGDEHPRLSLADLSKIVGLNKTTTRRLVNALAREGLVAQDATTGLYRLGPECIALGARALRTTDLRDAARPELEWLAHETGEVAQLEVLVGDETLIVDEVPGKFVLGAALSVGTRWPAHATSTGKAILAFLPDDELDAILPRRLTRPTSKTISDRETLRAELARVRERGYATALEELEENFVAVGAPVFNHEGHVIGAICIGGPSTRLTHKRLPEVSQLVKQAAARVSSRLGWRSELERRRRKEREEST